jgi:glycosyltransferase involved in cell wall biosynthesis
MTRAKPKVVITLGQTATLVGLSGAFLTSRCLRVYFRQHTSSNKAGKFSKGNLYDNMSNFLAQEIIVSNKNTYSYLVTNENVPESKISICEFGFDVESFVEKNFNSIDLMKTKYDLHNSNFVVGVVSRITPIKGLEFTFQAFKNFLNFYPDSILVLANAMDAELSDLEKLISLIPKDNLRILEREIDMVSVYACMSTLVHVPISSSVESYGLVYVEAFLSRLPAIITISGIAEQIAEPEVNCLAVEYQNSNQIFESLIRLRENDELRIYLGQNAFNSVSFLTLDRMNTQFRRFLQQALQ